jgi:putative hydrolase of the HAD superfamily
MSAAAPRAVLLDALGTLLDLPAPWPALVEQLGARGVDVSLDEARAALLAEIVYYRAHHDEASDRERLADLRARCTGVLAAALPARARVLPDLEAVLLASLRFAPYPDVPGTLAELRGRGTKLVVVSNWDVSLHDVLEDTGLAPLLDGAITSAEHGRAKPDPSIFAAALDMAGVAAHEALHVGDSLEADVDGAIAAGIAPVYLSRSGADGPLGVRTVASLAELLEAPA